MDLFEMYPYLQRPLHRRAVRLLAIAAWVYDARAFYLEVRTPQHPMRDDAGHLFIVADNVSLTDAALRKHARSPIEMLQRKVRRAWRMDVMAHTSDGLYIFDEAQHTTQVAHAVPACPCLLILSQPRLGGGPEVPDALATALYLMPVRRWLKRMTVTGTMMRIEWDALSLFFSEHAWQWDSLLAQPWATMYGESIWPADAQLRSVRTLRGLQLAHQLGQLPATMLQDARGAVTYG